MQDRDITTVALGPKRLLGALKFLLSTRKDVWIAGSPGIGKTDLVSAACAAADLHLLRHPPGVSMDPVDNRGLPHIRDGVTRWARAVLWPTAEEAAAIGKTIVVFLDELSQASLAVQASYMQAVQNRCIGEMLLPDNLCFVACGNRPEDRAGANKVITPLVSRFAQFELAVSANDWLEWAAEAGVAEDVRATVAYQPQLLNTFDPKQNQSAYACPRTWHKLGQALADQPPEELIPSLAASYLGHGPAAAFTTFRETRRDLPDLAGIWAAPERAPVPKEKPIVLYAMALALAEQSKEKKDLSALGTYGQRLPGEVSAFLLTEVFRANSTVQATSRKGDPKLFSSKQVMAWLMAHKDVLPDMLK